MKIYEVLQLLGACGGFVALWKFTDGNQFSFTWFVTIIAILMMIVSFFYNLSNHSEKGGKSK